ncbi:hypothetical protein FPANT_2886 [Fusarium pseudoanthophilum]|uniref:Uncharacterized protein n=1 Tax=Fusarium pseudoanthophilum TaxID=48495 RepID=A0A8H5PNX7_9HYPO|nr:hypothetical protein FPANT_2886 [Fusarium pseudoanthophilum]
MPSITDQELRALYDRIESLQKELEETKNYAAVLESNLKTARKTDPNAGNPGDAIDGLKEGENRIELCEIGGARFVKWTTGPVFFPAEYFAQKMNTDVESLWAANGPGSPEANTDDKSEKSEWEIV